MSGVGGYKDATWNGYITMTDDPLSPDPAFFTASVNAPDHPFLKLAPDASSTQGIPCGQIRCGQEYDFIDLKMTRDGTPWAIFIDACGTGTKDCLSSGFGEAVAAALDAAGPARTTTGRTITATRRYRTCAAKRRRRHHKP
jgi:hypothetical protein